MVKTKKMTGDEQSKRTTERRAKEKQKKGETEKIIERK